MTIDTTYLDNDGDAVGLARPALLETAQKVNILYVPTVANQVIYANGTDTMAATGLTAAGRALIDDADAAAQRTTLGLGTLATQSGTFSGTSSGTNTGDQTITLTGDVTGSGTGSFVTTIANNVVSLAKMATMATASFLGRNTSGTGNVEVLSTSTVKTLLSVNNVDNTSDANKPVSIAQASAIALKANLTSNTFTGAQVLSDQQVSRAMLLDCGNVFVDKGNSSTTTQTLDYTVGSHQKITATGNHTIATSNWPPTGNLGELLLELVNGGAFTVTWPTVNWVKSDGTTTTTFSSNGVTLQSSGTDWVLLWSRDAGTTIYGKIVR